MTPPLRILHLIDSLALGGAERVAVNLVNALNEQGVEAHLAASRKEGPLKGSLADPNRYLFLGKKHVLDVRAFARLWRYVRRQRIEIVHAHSSSLAWAVGLTAFSPVSVVWHNHNGNSEFLDRRRTAVLRWLVKRASHIVAVNQKLATWAVEQLNCPPDMVSYLPNFPDLTFQKKEGKKANKVLVIVCTANLRAPKDHEVLIRALGQLKQQGTAFEAWLIGKDAGDDYSRRLKALILQLGLEQEVRILGSQSDIGAWLSRADIGVLSSSSEGLPVALLEYGLAGLPVVCTSVGECPEVLGGGRYGLLVPPGSPEALAAAIAHLLSHPEERVRYGEAYQTHIQQHYTKAGVTARLIALYQKLVQPTKAIGSRRFTPLIR